MISVFRAFSLFLLCSSLALPAVATDEQSFSVPVIYYKLPNGLRVILSVDSSAPTVATAFYYRIGFRVEPKDRTGFAHLFEHMMFQGSQNLGKMEFIKLVQKNGGILTVPRDSTLRTTLRFSHPTSWKQRFGPKRTA